MDRQKIIEILRSWLPETKVIAPENKKEILENLEYISDVQLVELHEIYKAHAGKETEKPKNSALYKLLIFGVFVLLVLSFFWYKNYQKKKEAERFEDSMVAMTCDERVLEKMKYVAKHPQEQRSVEMEMAVLAEEIAREHGFDDMAEYERMLLKQAKDFESMMEMGTRAFLECGTELQEIEELMRR